MTNTLIADFSNIEYRDDQLKCPRCGEWRRVLLCVGKGVMICRECKNANKSRKRTDRALVDAAVEYTT